MHLEIYRRYAHVQAVVHAHPLVATALCASRTPVNCRFIAEAYAILGEPAYIPYACMGTPELADSVAQSAAASCCILMRNHGVLTTGSNLAQAADRMEVLEAAARTTVLLNQLQNGMEIAPADLAELDAMMGRTTTPVGNLSPRQNGLSHPPNT